ncbi:MAG: S-layer homology domain-containing protein, partial [Oscillospiraceae bacterium]
YNRQDNILTIPLPKTATPYILKYDADIADTSKTNFNNTAEVDGTEFKIVKETKNIITEDAGSIGTAAKRKGSLTITKNDSNDENRKVSGATFKIFLKSTGEEINTGITDEKGIVTFYLLSTNTDYTVKEVASPDMYVLDETPFDVTIGSGATKNIAQTRTNVRKLKVIYNGNGGKTKVTDPENYVPGTSVTVKEKGDTVRAGYAFAEWNTKADGTGDKYLKEGGNQFIITHDTILYAIWTPNNDTKYKIEHYKQNLEDKNFTIVTEDTENKTGKTDDTVSGTPKVYDGFTFDETIPESLKTATIKGDGSLVLKLYYTRNLYKVTYDGNGGKTAVEDEKSPYVYESLVTVKSKGNTKRDKYTFKGWNTSPDGKGVSYKVNGNETFTIIKDTTLYAQWSKNPEHSNNGGHHGGIIIEPSPAPTPAPSPTETPAPSPTETPTPDDTKPELLTGDHIWYLRGYPDNTIRPESNITRAEVSLVFFRLLENSSAIPTVDDIKFSDVSMKDWYGLAIGTLNKLGIIDGYEDGTFRPDEPMTREEAATVAIKFDGLEKVQENPFVDIDDTRWAYDYILSAYKKGWFKGYPDKTFKPDGDILRAEFATLVNNVTNRNVSQDGILSTAHMFSDLTPEHWAYEAMMEASHTHDFDRKNDNSLEIWTQITDTGLDEAYNL